LTYIRLFVLFNTALIMRLALAIQLLALPACLREVFVAASPDEQPAARSDSDSLAQALFTEACPDFAQYSQVRQYGLPKTNALYRDAKPTIVDLIVKAHWHYLSNDPSKTAAPSPLPRLKRS
jgi:hypothetical protein